MRKIFILLALFLMFGLLVGCASKPVQKTSKSVQRTPDGPVQDVSKMRNMSDEELLLYRIDKDLDDIKAIVYAPVVTYDDIETARKLASFYKKEQLKEFRDKFFTKTTRKDFSGKITNTTNDDVHLRIFPRGEYTYSLEIKDLPDVDFIIPPHETYYFIIENFFAPALCENMFAIQKMNKNRSYGGGYVLSWGNSTSNDLFFPVIEEILKYHSVELIYDHQPTDRDFNKGYNHKFVKPFD